MDRKQFWRFIWNSRRDSGGPNRAMADLLRARLEKRSKKEIEDYARVFGELMTESYEWRLWGAASIILGGCSDDSFDYFRCWLVAMGEKVYAKVLEDPEVLAGDVYASVLAPGAEFEDMLYVAVEAYEAKTGEELDDPNPARSGYRTGPKGRKWKASQLPKLFPGLAERFGRT